MSLLTKLQQVTLSVFVLVCEVPVHYQVSFLAASPPDRAAVFTCERLPHNVLRQA